MFDFKNTKSFMDTVHGYISVPTCFVDNIIDTEYFQRLRNIEQTGMRILYPDGKHDRFGHSLGVFYLGSKAVDSLLANFIEDKYWNINSNNYNDLFWAKNKVLFLVACLLHDIGHVPFSHSLEYLVYNNTSQNGQKKNHSYTFTDKLVEALNKKETNDKEKTIKSTQIDAAPHEQFGALIVLEEFEENIRNILNALIQEKFPHYSRNQFLYAEHLESKSTFETLTNTDLCFIARMIIGLPYNDYSPDYQIRNCFIELLNSNNLDVDKLDYILRDTQMSGISNIAIDVDRLINSICVITQTTFLDYHFDYDSFHFSSSTIHTIENQTDIINTENLEYDSEQLNSDSFFEIDGDIKGTFIIGPDVKVTIYNKSTLVLLSGDSSDGIKMIFANNKSEDPYFDSNSIIYYDGEIINREKRIPIKPDNDYFFCKIINAELEKGDFNFITLERGYVQINGYCHIKLVSPKNGSIRIKNSLVCRENVKLQGNVGKIIVLKDLLSNVVPNPSAYNTFKLGYKKQSMNLLANVLEARNYLYLWCYAHHKVIYYANFLLPALSQLIHNNKKISVFNIYDLSYDNIIILDDSYVWTVLHNIKKNNKVDSDEKKLLDELFTHKYKKSVWKSLPEFDLLFESFNTDQQISIHNYFQHIVNKERIRVFKANPNPEDNTNCVGGFLINEFIVLIKKQHPSLEDLLDIVFVDAGYTQKGLSPHDTFIKINNEVVIMERIPLLTGKIKDAFDTSFYFYLYYDTVSGEILSEENTYLLKNAIRDLMFYNIDMVKEKAPFIDIQKQY